MHLLNKKDLGERLIQANVLFPYKLNLMDTKTLTVLDFAKPPASFLHFLVTCILLACLWNKYNHCHLLLNKQPSELLSDGKVTKTQRLKQGQIMHNAQYKCYTAGK